MNTKEFEYLVEIGRHESISKAAAHLYLSQPTLTKFLQKLEADYGVPLFDRVGKKMIPTEAGRCCIRKAEQILALAQEADDQIRYISQKDSGLVRIGTALSRSEFFINQILPKLTKRHPDLNFVLSLKSREELQKKLEDKTLDIIFVNSYTNRPYLDYTTIGEEEMVLVVPQGHPLTAKAAPREGLRYPYIPFEEWSRYPFISVPPRLTTGQYTRQIFQHYGAKPRIILEVETPQSVYSAVHQNIGIAIAPSMPLISAEHRSTLTYLSLDDTPSAQWSFSAITRSHVSLHPIIPELIKTTKDAYTQLLAESLTHS